MIVNVLIVLICEIVFCSWVMLIVLLVVLLVVMLVICCLLLVKFIDILLVEICVVVSL